jgi:small subunit ribosomal protein S17
MMEDTENTPADETSAEAAEVTETTTETGAGVAAAPHGRRQEKIGLVTSNKMIKTVVVRVERQIRHPKYRRYIRRRKKFMAHDEIGANIGDIVRIVETRPLSARKRWRVVEIVQKAS